MELTSTQVQAVVTRMRLQGFDVAQTVHEGSLAFTCPARSRLLFGAVIADVMGGIGAAVGLLMAARTSHDRQTREVTLYFPGFTAEQLTA